MFVDISLGSSKREAKPSWTRAALSKERFSNSFLVPVGQETGKAYGGIQVKLMLWERLVQSKKVGEEAERRSAEVGDSGRGDQPTSVVLQE